ncbi:hypothetical protein L1280_000941 [Deinococcus sp. HSC-46F16]|uniref:hypothetical protein n=1 Tax=Deinococcus sp. HSC-46F16 TaxID=2910968 RepID=UPI0020A15A82|nr:hypothetical protein [Deinococcus sp. HSC-46F16]MCP2013813.1 hypothetical protein [Deinococcus sp. HSC-46F16]
MKKALLVLAALALLTPPAGADHQQGNLRSLVAADLCPPVASVYVDDEESDDLGAALDEQLMRYATLYGVPSGDPKTCTVQQIFSVDAFETEDGEFLYALDLSLQLRPDVRVTLGSRQLTVKALELWSTSGYGRAADAAGLVRTLTNNVRAYYEDFALEWKATHPTR